MPIWRAISGEKVACYEKIKIMQENISELQQMAQDLYEDGILMEIDPLQLKNFLIKMMDNLVNPYEKE